MRKHVLVIGGTRFFGRLLVERLLDAGHRVTLATRGLAGDAFGDRVDRIRVDRRDAAAMRAAFGGSGYDLVYDQVCYSPVDASIAVATFGDRVDRYVMASTIEVYDRVRGAIRRPLREDDLDLAAEPVEPVEPGYPWHAPAQPAERYGMGKRQAEAVLAASARPVVRVRIGHVLGGADDFTGRLASYVRQVDRGARFAYASDDGLSSFLSAAAIADFLAWCGDGDFTGAINAACDGPLSALDLHRRVAAVRQRTVGIERATPAPGAALSPFDYDGPYVMDTARARSLGYRFPHTDAWIDRVIVDAARAVAA